MEYVHKPLLQGFFKSPVMSVSYFKESVHTIRVKVKHKDLDHSSEY